MVLGFQFSFRPPPLNPPTKKAQRIPVFNPIDRHGRVFFFSWMGFLVAFWAWYTFPPLLTHTIKHTLHLTPTQISNSNILSLLATLLVRLLSGHACDLYGPRLVFASILLVGCIPIGLAPLIQNVTGLYVIRFFIGILGGSFVPCQVWTTAWFDKNVVGTANAVAGGWGNAGGGVTYFVMPAVVDGLVSKWGMGENKAWRVSFVVPLVCLLVCGFGLVLLCEDTPTGRWKDREFEREGYVSEGGNGDGDGDGTGDEEVVINGVDPNLKSQSGTQTPTPTATATVTVDEEKGSNSKPQSQTISDTESTTTAARNPDVEKAEAVPTLIPGSPNTTTTTNTPVPISISTILLSPQTLFHTLTYACSFGSELAINSILASYFLSVSPSSLTQTSASNYAAIFGFLNFVTRPAGGLISDLVYNLFGGGGSFPLPSPNSRSSSSSSSSSSGTTNSPNAKSLWARKLWISTCCLLSGIFLLLLGLLSSSTSSSTSNPSLGTVIALVILAAIFLEAGNGANFGLLPFIWPERNGLVSGVTGAGGNLGGVMFALVFRFVHVHGGGNGGGNGAEAQQRKGYEKAIWILGVINLVVGVLGVGVWPVPTATRSTRRTWRTWRRMGRKQQGEKGEKRRWWWLW